jgi:hypothetical protein
MKLFRTALLLTSLLTILSNESVKAQVEFGKNDTLMVQAVVVDGDTIPFAYLPMVNIYSQRIFKSKRAQVKYTKLRRDVIKVWPYAKLAGEKFQQLEKELHQLIHKTTQLQVIEFLKLKKERQHQDQKEKILHIGLKDKNKF